MMYCGGRETLLDQFDEIPLNKIMTSPKDGTLFYCNGYYLSPGDRRSLTLTGSCFEVKNEYACDYSSDMNSHKQRGWIGTDWITDGTDSSTSASAFDSATNSEGTFDTETSERKKPAEMSLDEEEVRRKIRRERNKMAAAKCRQRRVDLTNHLLAQSEMLSVERTHLEEEISILHQQRNELRHVLEEHVSRCQATVSSIRQRTEKPSTQITGKAGFNNYSKCAASGMTSSNVYNQTPSTLEVFHSSYQSNVINLDQMDLVPFTEGTSFSDPLFHNLFDYVGSGHSATDGRDVQWSPTSLLLL